MHSCKIPVYENSSLDMRWRIEGKAEVAARTSETGPDSAKWAKGIIISALRAPLLWGSHLVTFVQLEKGLRRLEKIFCNKTSASCMGDLRPRTDYSSQGI